jgi:hypothetical protein
MIDEMLEEISNLIVAGICEEGQIVIEWKGVDLCITVTREVKENKDA